MSLIDNARAVLDAAREDPQSALRTGAELLERADGDETLATVRFAMGLAHRTLANGAESTEHLEAAAGHAADFDELRGQILRSLAFNYAQAGDHDLADKTIATSIGLVTGQERFLSRLQQAFMLLMRGEHRAALPALSAAVDGFTASGDDGYLELTLYNRALVHMEFGDYDSSVADLERAYEIGIRLDHQVSAADAALHLSQVLGWRDDVPGAMEWHARSVELRSAARADNPVADTEHAFVLLQARLMREAEQTLRTAIPRLVAAGDNHAIIIAGRLLLADVLIETGNHAAAIAELQQAAAESPVDGRWRFDIAAARHRARIAAGERTTELLGSMLSTADDMEANGEVHPAAVERFRAVGVALELQDLDTARELTSAAEHFATTGPLWLQIQACTALARVRRAEDNSHEAETAVRAGMSRVDQYRSGIGATDLRLQAAGLGAELATMGLDLAVQSGSAERVFDWSERLRGTSARHRQSDPEVGAALADLRRAAARARAAAADEAADAREQLLRAEATVTALTRRQRGTADNHSPSELPPIQKHLEDRTLIEFVEVGTSLYAVVADRTTSRLEYLANAVEIGGIVDHLRFAAERIARPSTSAASRDAAIASATETAELLRITLLEPLGISTARMVIAPSGFLHSVPWTLVSNTPVETTPSAGAWMAARTCDIANGKSLVVSGPGLVHAAGEVRQIAAAGDALVTESVADTTRYLGGAAQAHFACHARPRTDSPMFSSLVLHDGELTLHDIERLDRSPGTVVLATCAGGGTVLASGEEVLSLAGSFLALGARTVLAPLFTVSDVATAEVMRALHAMLAAGVDPASALLEIRRSTVGAVAFTAGSFSCFGAS